MGQLLAEKRVGHRFRGTPGSEDISQEVLGPGRQAAGEQKWLYQPGSLSGGTALGRVSRRPLPLCAAVPDSAGLQGVILVPLATGAVR